MTDENKTPRPVSSSQGRDSHSYDTTPTEIFPPVDEPRPVSSSQNEHGRTREEQYSQPRDPYGESGPRDGYGSRGEYGSREYDQRDYGQREYSPRDYDPRDYYDERPRQYFPGEGGSSRVGASRGGNDYVTRNEVLESENYALQDELRALQEQKNHDDEELDTLRDELESKSRLVKGVFAIAALATLLVLVLLVWNPLSNEGDTAAKDAEISQLQGKVDQLTQERDKALKNTDDSDGQLSAAREKVVGEQERADKAERALKDAQSDLDRVTRERDQARAELKEARENPETVTETRIVTAPDEEDSLSSGVRGLLER